MPRLPASLNAHYRLATTQDIHAFSFGQVKFCRNAVAEGWKQQHGTLYDQAIFGPLWHHVCACHKYIGEEYKGLICDQCGVKITSADVRRRRFGHIELTVTVPHPFAEHSHRLAAFPVLPAEFLTSLAGEPLADIYEGLLEVSASGDETKCVEVLERLVEALLPVAQIALEWGLAEGPVFARALALQLRDPPGER